MILSLRARAALQFFVNSDKAISADRLAEVCTEGRKACQTALKELRGVGLISTRKERVNNRVVTVSYVTEEGFVEAHSWGSGTVLQIQHSVQNSNINIYANSALNIKKTTRSEFEGGESPMGYEFFASTQGPDTEIQDAKRKASARRQAEYDEAKREAHAQKVLERANTTPADWNLNQLVNYFAEKVNDLWGIQPWRLSGSRFYAALGKYQKKYGTTAEIDKLAMDMFFSTLKHDSQTNGEMLWKLFIMRYVELTEQAKLQVNAEEKLVTAQVDAEDSWKGM